MCEPRGARRPVRGVTTRYRHAAMMVWRRNTAGRCCVVKGSAGQNMAVRRSYGARIQYRNVARERREKRTRKRAAVRRRLPASLSFFRALSHAAYATRAQRCGTKIRARRRTKNYQPQDDGALLARARRPVRQRESRQRFKTASRCWYSRNVKTRRHAPKPNAMSRQQDRYKMLFATARLP